MPHTRAWALLKGVCDVIYLLPLLGPTNSSDNNVIPFLRLGAFMDYILSVLWTEGGKMPTNILHLYLFIYLFLFTGN